MQCLPISFGVLTSPKKFMTPPANNTDDVSRKAYWKKKISEERWKHMYGPSWANIHVAQSSWSH